MLPIQILQSDKDTDFVLAQAQNVSDNANLTGLDTNEVTIRDVIILSDQPLAWEVQLYTTDGFENADADLDTYLASIRFSEGDGKQIDGAGLYRYDVHGLSLFYEDLDATNELHVKLVNRSATAKNAGATGEIVVKFAYEKGQWG